MLQFFHHGAIDGVTGSCHELRLENNEGLLIDCGMFQGKEDRQQPENRIPFNIAHIKALLVTHVHIDHIGRIPHLVAAGFKGPIFCTEASAKLLPLVIEDALKIGFSVDQNLIKRALKVIVSRIHPVPYDQWTTLPTSSLSKVRFQPAGHILGSAYLELDITSETTTKRIVYSGDLGASFTPLLPDPKSPEQADILFLESTYGDKNHHGREQRNALLKQTLLNCFENKGLVLIPAFSIGRTQELLYEIESILHQMKGQKSTLINWDDLDIILDSPLAHKFTQYYLEMKDLWDAEAKKKVLMHRHPLDFEQLTTLASHHEHVRAVKVMSKSTRPAIVIAAGGMCNGGRIVNWLKANIANPITEILLVGYQAEGTTGRVLQNPKSKKVKLDGEFYELKAKVLSLSSYSAHADQNDLIRFVKGIKKKPTALVLVHGINDARRSLAAKFRTEIPEIEVFIPHRDHAKRGYSL